MKKIFSNNKINKFLYGFGSSINISGKRLNADKYDTRLETSKSLSKSWKQVQASFSKSCDFSLGKAKK